MKIPEEVKKAEARLSRINLDFLDFVRENPVCLDRSGFKLLELNDDLFTLQPWPTFINRENRDRFQVVSLEMQRLIKLIPLRVFGNNFEKMSRYYEIPVNTIELQLEGVNEEHLENLLGRGDFILSDAGLKCLEYNFSASLGGWQVPIWEGLYLNTPLIARFFKEYGIKTIEENLILSFLEHVVQSAPGEVFRRDGKMNIAMVSPGLKAGRPSTQSYLNLLYKKVLQQKAGTITGSVFMCDYQNLEIVNGYVFHQKEKIHTLVELYRGHVPPEIKKVFKSGNIRLMNGPVSGLLANKLNLALLSEHETVDGFTDGEREFIDRHVPWTRKIKPGITTWGGKTIDLVDFILSHRERLVVKPGADYGGKGVCVGMRVSDLQWKESVETALHEKNWVVQEFVASAPGLYQAGESGSDIHDMTWGFFVFGPHYAGVWVRVLPRKNNKGVINCHQGASVSVVFNVDE
jgi:hypothetical protein